MKNWVTACLRETAERFEPAQDADLISDLSKIAECCEQHLSGVYWNAETETILDKLMLADTLSEVSVVMDRMRTAYGLQHVTISILKEAAGLIFKTRVLTTYPKKWIRAYIAERYQLVDPVLFERHPRESFFWDELRDAAPVVEDYLRKARAAGIGPSGYTSCLQVLPGTVVAVSITSPAHPDEFRQMVVNRMRNDLDDVFSELASAFARANGIIGLQVSEANDDELALLRAVAYGGSRREISKLLVDLGVGPGAAGRVCKRLGAKTLAQAAVAASSTGILSYAPLRLEDVSFTREGAVDTPRITPRGDDIPDAASPASRGRMRRRLAGHRNGKTGTYSVRACRGGWAVYRDGVRVSEVMEEERHAEKACTRAAWARGNREHDGYFELAT